MFRYSLTDPCELVLSAGQASLLISCAGVMEMKPPQWQEAGGHSDQSFGLHRKSCTVCALKSTAAERVTDKGLNRQCPRGHAVSSAQRDRWGESRHSELCGPNLAMEVIHYWNELHFSNLSTPNKWSCSAAIHLTGWKSSQCTALVFIVCAQFLFLWRTRWVKDDPTVLQP